MEEAYDVFSSISQVSMHYQLSKLAVLLIIYAIMNQAMVLDKHTSVYYHTIN